MAIWYEVIVEKHPDGHVAYSTIEKGVVVGEGNTFEEALSDLKSAIAFHIETFAPEITDWHLIDPRLNL